MAYGIEYQLLCNSKEGNLFKAKISEDAYGGAEVDRNVPINPFKLRKDKADVVRGTSFEFAVREAVDFEFLKFCTSVPKKYLVQLFKATTQIWSGYLNTQQYSADYKPVPNTIWFTASDGLGLLKNEAFTLTGLQSEMAIINHCIDKMDLGLGYAIAVSMWEKDMNTALAVFAQAYLDCDIFEDKNCYDVLEEVIGRYDAEISQVNNRWEIISSIDKKSTRMLYTSAGVYDTTQAAPVVLDLGYPTNPATEVYPTGSALTHSMQYGGRQIKITHDYGLRKSLLPNYRFRKYASSMFTDWTLGGTAVVTQGFKDGNFYAGLHSNGNVDTDYIETSISLINISGEAFVFEINVCPVAKDIGAHMEYTSVPLEVRMRVTLVVGGTTYYLTTSGWDTTSGLILATINSVLTESGIIWTKVKIITDEIPGDGVLTCRLIAAFTTGYGIPSRKVTFNEPSVYFLDAGELYDEKYEETAVFDNSAEMVNLSDYSMIAADAPEVTNKSLLYDNIIRKSDGTPTSEWKLSGNDTAFTFLQLYLKLLASRNRMPHQTLTGLIKGAGINFNSIIKHAYNSDREFEIAECEWDMHEESFRVTLLEILAFSDEHITLSDGTILHSAANLTVATVTPAAFEQVISGTFNVTVHVDNSGESAGRQLIEWQVLNEDHEADTWGSHITGVIAAGGHEDHVIALTAPPNQGIFYVECKILTDEDWVSSAAITVMGVTDVTLNHIDTIATGGVLDPMTFAFEATNTGIDGSVEIFWKIYDRYDAISNSGSQVEEITNGTATYNLTGITYPPDPDTGYYATINLDGVAPVTSNDFEVTI